MFVWEQNSTKKPTKDQRGRVVWQCTNSNLRVSKPSEDLQKWVMMHCIFMDCLMDNLDNHKCIPYAKLRRYGDRIS